jgi:hypothetical protein
MPFVPTLLTTRRTAIVGWLLAMLVLASPTDRGSRAALQLQEPKPDLYVSATGSDAGRCSKAAPCASFDRAYHVAKPGEIVEVAAGTYPPQLVKQDLTKTSPNDVVFRPAPGASVFVAGRLDLGDFDVRGASHITVRGLKAEEIRAINSVSDVTLQNIDARNFYLNGVQNVLIKGGDWGPCTTRVDPCSNSKIDLGDAATGPENRNITIDGAVFHDYRVSSPEDHFECLFILSGTNIAIRNSRFSGCAYYNIFLQHIGERRLGDLTIERNWFSPTTDGFNQIGNRDSGIAFSPRGHPFANVLIRSNSFIGGTGISVNDDGDRIAYSRFRVVGNIGKRSCNPAAEFEENIWSGGKCSPTDRDAPYGYALEDGRLRTVADRAAAVRQLFADAAAGRAFKDIAGRLRRVAPGPSGGRWRIADVRRVLPDRAYLGGLYGAQGAHPGLVSRRTWQRAQSRLK